MRANTLLLGVCLGVFALGCSDQDSARRPEATSADASPQGDDASKANGSVSSKDSDDDARPSKSAPATSSEGEDVTNATEPAAAQAAGTGDQAPAEDPDASPTTEPAADSSGEATPTDTEQAAGGDPQPPNGTGQDPASTGMGTSTDTGTGTGTAADPAPPQVQATHKIAVTCANFIGMAFTFGGRTEALNVAQGVSINGQPSKVATTHCPKIKAALDAKALPTGKTLSKPTGGTAISAKCDAGTLSISFVEGNPMEGGTGVAQRISADIESFDVCLEVRNIINGLALNKL